MVSGFLISPNDHERIFSGEASAIRIWSKVGAAWTGLKMFRTSWFILVPSAGLSRANDDLQIVIPDGAERKSGIQGVALDPGSASLRSWTGMTVDYEFS